MDTDAPEGTSDDPNDPSSALMGINLSVNDRCFRRSRVVAHRIV